MSFLSENEILKSVGEVELKRLPLHLHLLPETGSTNQVAFELAQKGAPEGTVVLADSQTGGKGRLDRKWESPPGKNVYLSFVLRPKISPALAPQLTLVAGIACYQTLESFISKGLWLKWPNDLYVTSKKIGGILTEMSARASSLDFVIVGIGLNLNSSLSDFSEEVRSVATSLFLESQTQCSRSEVTGRLLSFLIRDYQRYLTQGFSWVRQEWEECSQMKGQKIWVEEGSQKYEGVCEGLDEEGFLVMKTETETKKILAGDVTQVSSRVTLCS